jgi:hypothetical protein
MHSRHHAQSGDEDMQLQSNQNKQQTANKTRQAKSNQAKKTKAIKQSLKPQSKQTKSKQEASFVCFSWLLFVCSPSCCMKDTSEKGDSVACSNSEQR